jgi:hypothetical protein
MRITPHRLTKVGLRLSGVIVAGAIATACSTGGGSATPPTVARVAGHSLTTTTTTTTTTPTTLPECGATRDPLDPTNSNAANC